MRQFLYNNPLLLEPIPGYRYFGQMSKSYNGFIQFRPGLYCWRAVARYVEGYMFANQTIQHFVSGFIPQGDNFYKYYRIELAEYYRNYYRIFAVLQRQHLPFDFSSENEFLDRFERMSFVTLSFQGKYFLELLVATINQMMLWRTSYLGFTDSELIELKRIFLSHPNYYLDNYVHSNLFTSEKSLFD